MARGSAAERYACRWLEQRGLNLLHTNYRCKAGELDLIMADADCLVIVEVRYRRADTHGGALGSVTRSKQRRIMQTTRHLLQRYPALQSQALRFDVLALTGTGKAATVRWFKNAFDAS